MDASAESNSYRWVIVAAGGLIGCVAAGSLFSLPVLIGPLSRASGWSVTGISLSMTIGFLSLAAGSLAWGSLSDRIGTRPVVLGGAVGIPVGLLLASRATELAEFQFLFGILVGGSTAAVFTPLMACVTGWFDRHRSLAVSLVSAGIGMAPMTMSPLVARLVTTHDWRTTLQIVAGVAAAVMIPTALLIRRAPALERATEATSEAAPHGEMSLREALKSAPFIVLVFTNFFCCATHSGPIFHTIGYAVSCGIPLVAAVSIYSIEGLAGLGGRVAFGLMGDRFGAKRVLVTGLLLQAFGALAYVFVRDLAGFYAVAALFGFIYAGVMPLYPVLARENFPLRMMGTIIGGTTLAGSLGMAMGPLAGGLIHDHLGSYSWLYLGSFGMGIGAFLIAMTFRPIPARGAPDLLAKASTA